MKNFIWWNITIRSTACCFADEALLIADGFFAGDFKAQNRAMKEAEAAAKEEKNRKLAPFQEQLNELVASLAGRERRTP